MHGTDASAVWQEPWAEHLKWKRIGCTIRHDFLFAADSTPSDSVMHERKDNKGVVFFQKTDGSESEFVLGIVCAVLEGRTTVSGPLHRHEVGEVGIYVSLRFCFHCG